MDELIRVRQNSKGENAVSGRELHEFLGVKTDYRKWFPRMVEYGFDENTDYLKVSQKCPSSTTGQIMTDHIMTLDMAKEISMIQRTDKGKEARKYFIQVEKQFKKQLHSYMIEDPIERAQAWIAEQEEKKQLQKQLEVLAPKADYTDMILGNSQLLDMRIIAQDYGMSSQEMNNLLYEMGIQYKGQDKRWHLYALYKRHGYVQSKTLKHKKSLTYMAWTQKGRLFLYEELKKNDILPLIEKGDF